jgi:hypothetical protein
MKITIYRREERPPILQRVKDLGYATFEDKDHDLNLIGVRAATRRPGKFDDKFHAVYLEGGFWIHEEYICTVDPSLEQHVDPTNPKGVAILKAGQYRGCWRLDMHRGSYLALCQREGEVTVYRDNTEDSSSDHIREESGMYGINIHRAHEEKLVDSTRYYSAGCTAIRHPADFARLIALCKMQRRHGPGYFRFSYTLLED